MCDNLISYLNFCCDVKPIFNEIKEVYKMIDDQYFDYSKLKDMSIFFSTFYNYISKKRYTEKEIFEFIKDNSISKFRYNYLLLLARSPFFKKYFKQIIKIENIDIEINEIKIFMRNKYILFLLGLKN